MTSKNIAAYVAAFLFAVALFQFLDAPTKTNFKTLAVRTIPFL